MRSLALSRPQAVNCPLCICEDELVFRAEWSFQPVSELWSRYRHPFCEMGWTLPSTSGCHHPEMHRNMDSPDKTWQTCLSGISGLSLGLCTSLHLSRTTKTVGSAKWLWEENKTYKNIKILKILCNTNICVAETYSIHRSIYLKH